MRVFLNHSLLSKGTAMFDRDARIILPYPNHTHIRLIEQSPQHERNLIVHSVRDLVTTPLTLTEFLRRPYTARSRFLLRAWDADKRAFRQFYVGSSRKFMAPGCLRLVIEDPDSDAPVTVVSRQFEPTVTDRRAAVRLIQAWLQKQPDLVDKLKIRADDMRLHG